jgi:tetratricopeptide (TPR) repeat protein
MSGGPEVHEQSASYGVYGQDFWESTDRRGDVGQIVKELEDEVKRHPDDPDLYLKLGFAYNLLCRWVDVAQTLDRAIELYNRSSDNQRTGKTAAAHFLRGYAWASVSIKNNEKEPPPGALLAAEESFRKAIELVPSFAEAHYYLGSVYDSLQRLEDAEKEFKEAIKSDPDHARAYSDLGVLYQELGRKEEALPLFQRSVEAEPQNQISLENLAGSYLQLGDLQAAKATFERAIQVNDASANAYHGLGVVALQMGNLEGAKQALNKVIELNPENSDAYNNLGVVYSRLDCPEKAIQLIKKSLVLNPDRADIRYNLHLANLDALEETILSKFASMKQEGAFDANRLLDQVALSCSEIFETNTMETLLTGCDRRDFFSVLESVADKMEPDQRLEFAAKVFERMWLSSGMAARLAGIDRISFLMKLHCFGIAVLDLDEQEMENEARYARGE